MSSNHAATTACPLAERAAAAGPAGPPPGLAWADAPATRRLVPPVKVRCRAQPPDAPPAFACPRFAWNRRELAGALGDLGTFLPHIIAAITVVGMPATGVLTGFGLAYLAAGAAFGVPMGVQPMKAASAALLIQQLAPGEIAGRSTTAASGRWRSRPA